MGRHTISVLTTVPIAITAGVILGFLAGLGVGGGSLLILWLTLALNMDPDTARAINLMFFITAAGSVSIFRLRQGIIKWKEILPAIVSGCIAAALFSLVSSRIDQDTVKKLFGGLLLITGIRELLYRPRKAR